MAHGTGTTLTLFDAAGNPVAVKLQDDGSYALSVANPENALIVGLLKAILNELQEIKENAA